MSEVTVLGLGRVGYRTLKLLHELLPDANFNAVDANPGVKPLAEALGRTVFHVYSQDVLKELAKKSDLFVTALPSSTAFPILKSLAEECVDIVDVSFTREDPYLLEPVVEKCGTVFIPDAGFAPGYSNLIAGYVEKELGGLESIDIMVGGIPSYPIPPLGYVVTWNPFDLIEEYKRPARIIRNGELVAVDPLSETITVDVEGVGMLEGFVSDGLRTLLRNIRARNMREVTLRWPGHVGYMKFLRDLGLMSEDYLEIDNTRVQPVRVLAKIFETRLKADVNDVAILHVEATGIGGGRYVETAVLQGTVENPATPFFTALVHAYASYLAAKRLVKPGVQPLENMSEHKQGFQEFLEAKNVKIRIKRW